MVGSHIPSFHQGAPNTCLVFENKDFITIQLKNFSLLYQHLMSQIFKVKGCIFYFQGKLLCHFYFILLSLWSFGPSECKSGLIRVNQRQEFALSEGANSFPLGANPTLEGLFSSREANRKSQKLFPFAKMMEKSLEVSIQLKMSVHPLFLISFTSFRLLNPSVTETSPKIVKN